MAVILVADPDRDERELYIFALRFAGHQLFGASDLLEVDQLARENQPDLLLVDTRLMDGIERTARPVVAGILDLHIPVVYLGDQDQPAETRRSLESPGSEYLYRPISLDQLTKRVHRTLEKANKR